MDFKQLQSFVSVVECGSFTRAAERLFVSQPTISAHIRALEEELKTTLIVRTTKSIEVTPNGKRVYDDAVSILKLKEHIVQTCITDQKRILRVAASTIPASYMLPEILPEFGRFYPQIYFSIHRQDHESVLAGVEQGKYDFGFSTSCCGEGLTCMPVCTDRMVLITPVTPDYLQMQTCGETMIEQLFAQPIILREKNSSGQKRSDRYLAQLGYDEKKLDVVARANDQESVKNLVAGGMGVSLISYRAARNFIEEKRVLCFELPMKSEKTIYLVYRKTQEELEHMECFVRFVQSKYSIE